MAAEQERKEFLLDCLAGIRREMKKIRKEQKRQRKFNQPIRIYIIMNNQEHSQLEQLRIQLEKVNGEYSAFREEAAQKEAASAKSIADLNAKVLELESQLADQADPAAVQSTIDSIKGTLQVMDDARADATTGDTTTGDDTTGNTTDPAPSDTSGGGDTGGAVDGVDTANTSGDPATATQV